MAFNTALKAAIFESRKTQAFVARRAKMHASDLSKVIRGYRVATDAEREKLAKILQRPIHELFPEVAA